MVIMTLLVPQTLYDDSDTDRNTNVTCWSTPLAGSHHAVAKRFDMNAMNKKVFEEWAGAAEAGDILLLTTNNGDQLVCVVQARADVMLIASITHSMLCAAPVNVKPPRKPRRKPRGAVKPKPRRIIGGHESDEAEEAPPTRAE